MVDTESMEVPGEQPRLMDAGRLPSCSLFSQLQQLHGGARKIGRGLAWNDICFNVDGKDPPILANVSGSLHPRRLLAIMGESGSGKTSLMNVLSGRQRTRAPTAKCGGRGNDISFSGTIATTDGKSAKRHDRMGNIAYVFQDIALIATETARECLTFSAYLRLPTTVKDADRNTYVHGMLSCLHLEQCADTAIGSTLFKGLSGGEQRRVSIGVELVCNPGMLFLDEPLSGLDACNAFTVVRTLKLLSEAGVPVMMSIHQPSSEIFEMMDDVMVMHQGEVCFHGPSSSFTRHMDGMGYKCPSNHNPADFVMFLFGSMKPEATRKLKDAWPGSEVAQEVRRMELLCPGGEDEMTSSSEEEESADSSDESSDDVSPRSGPFGNRRKTRGICGQLAALVLRDRRMMCRLRVMIVGTNVTSLIVSLAYGWFFFGAGRNEANPDNENNCRVDSFNTQGCYTLVILHIAIISLVALNMMFQALGLAIEIIHKERAVLLREIGGNFYGITAFFLSKCLMELVFMSISTFVMLLGTYWLAALRANFFILFAEILLMSFGSASLMYVLACWSKTRDQAATLYVLPQVLQFAFSGLIIPASMVPPSLQWLKWLCPLYYGIGVVQVTEFRYVFEAWDECEARNATATADCKPWAVRRNVLANYGAVPGDKLFYVTMLIVLSIVYRVIAVWLLKRNTKFAV